MRAAATGVDLLIEPINGPDVPGHFLSTQTQAHAMAHAGTTTVAATDGPHHRGDEPLHSPYDAAVRFAAVLPHLAARVPPPAHPCRRPRPVPYRDGEGVSGRTAGRVRASGPAKA